MSDDLTTYRRILPHWRMGGATYFITWRLDRDQAELDGAERSLVAGALTHFSGERYALLAYVVMDNHVHVLVTPISPHELQAIVHSWKSFTAHRLQRPGRAKRIWQTEYFDRIVRNEIELREKLDYIAGNPLKRWPGVTSYPWLWIE
ncbi:MAG: transposase [bacterium]